MNISKHIQHRIYIRSFSPNLHQNNFFEFFINCLRWFRQRAVGERNTTQQLDIWVSSICYISSWLVSSAYYQWTASELHSVPVRPCRRLFHLSDHQIAGYTTLMRSANVVSTSSQAYTVYGVVIDETVDIFNFAFVDNFINFHTLILILPYRLSQHLKYNFYFSSPTALCLHFKHTTHGRKSSG